MSYRTDTINALFAEASRHRGNRARAGRVTQYGEKTASNGKPWSGAFLEYVFRVTETRGEPALTETSAALAEYIRDDRIRMRPKRGDLVFLPPASSFESMRIGLVDGTEKYAGEGVFTAIVGEVATGLPRGPQEQDGVYLRTFTNADVIAFARPRYRKPGKPGQFDAPKIQVARVRAGVQTKSNLYVQRALAESVGLRGASPSVFDARTQAAYARYERKIGHTTGDGTPSEIVLRRLTLDTGGKHFAL